MNVCVVAYTFYELDHRVRRYAELLADGKNRVDVLSLRWKQAPSKRGTLRKVNVFRIQARNQSEKTPLQYLFNILLFFIKGTVCLLFRHLRYHYEIIHIHNMPDFLVFMGLIPKLLGAKIILDIHDIMPEYYCQKINKKMNSLPARLLLKSEKTCVRYADYVIVANDLWRNKIIGRDGISENKCIALLNYPITQYFEVPSSGHRRNHAFTIIYPGTISHLHGVDIAIKAISIVKSQLSNVQLKIYGPSGDQFYFRYLKALIDELHIRQHVYIFEPVRPEELKLIYEEADVGIVPKRAGIFASEAFSSKIFDYMTVGIPVVASRTTIDEYYFDDSMIVFFKAEDHEDLARCLVEIYHNREKAESMVQKGKYYILENNWDAKKSIYQDIIRQLVSRHPR